MSGMGVVAFDKVGDGYVDLAYGDQTPYDPNARGGEDSAIVLNMDGTLASMTKDPNFVHDGNASNSNRNQMQFDMELSGVDLNNDGTVDLVFHATVGSNHLGNGAGGGGTNSSNSNRLVVASNQGNDGWYVTQIINDVFQRGDDDPGITNAVSMTWADFNGDGYMDLFLGRGEAGGGVTAYNSRILFNDGNGNLSSSAPTGIGTATGVYAFNDSLYGGASLAIDWNHDGKIDIIELPGMGTTGGMTAAGRTGPINLYTNTSTGNANAFTTSNLLGGSNTIGFAGNVIASQVTGAITADIDWDGAKDLLVFTQNGTTKFIHNENIVEDGTSLHFKILDQQGINALYGNTVQLFDSKGNLVAVQVLNPQSANQTNDSSAIVDFYNLDPSETYSLVLLRNVGGQSADIGGLASLGGNTIENVNSAWTGLKAGEANEAYVLTAESGSNAANANINNGIVGTGYNDTFSATKGTDAYNGGGGTVTTSGVKAWTNTGGMDIVDYRVAGNQALTIDLSKSDYQNTGFNTAKFVNIEGIYGANGNDTFTDDAFDNIFNGRGGNDAFFLTRRPSGGNGGKDTLLYELLDNGDGRGGNGHDTVNGFTVGTYEATPNADRIDISDLLTGYQADSDGPAHYINGVATIDAGDTIADYLSVTHEGNNATLHIDRDGKTGVFDSQIILTLVNIGDDVDLATLLANHQIVV